ncbi:L-fucose mutarotase [Gracilibacillus oryzae]|uniref:L-fucose mutarotase n=1 Tax=Gracilibacillus oryzae TaxID=1672701 RepID=A0A7C8KPD3_9BACI|nr:L-fucose mutarotase [Gracilibacillus oryzae]KAB8130775.1 L-fucose mutarotase [Gracilibacillus oryzae]
MLKGISPIISPDLLKILMEMGHGDEIVIADGNFPSASHGERVVRCDGSGTTELLEAILPLFPLDSYADYPIALMQVVPGDTVKTPIWDDYKAIVADNASEPAAFEEVERFAFYERAKKAYAIVTTSERALYANIILKKGVVTT